MAASLAMALAVAQLSGLVRAGDAVADDSDDAGDDRNENDDVADWILRLFRGSDDYGSSSDWGDDSDGGHGSWGGGGDSGAGGGASGGSGDGSGGGDNDDDGGGDDDGDDD